jgi:putative endopeptidase
MQTNFLSPAALAPLFATAVFVGALVPATSQAFVPNMDTKTGACQDFFQHACGGWIKANPIPAEEGRWGSFDRLAENNRKLLLTLIRNAGASKAAPGTPAQQVGDFFAACMDTARTEQIGLSALVPKFDALGNVKSKDDLATLVAAYHMNGVGLFFSFTARADFKNANQNIAVLDQGGLSLPEREYYLDDNDKAKALRDKYVAHVQRMFELIGAPKEEAQASAQAVLKIETAIAQGHMDKVSRRIPERTYNIKPLIDLDSLAPGFQWSTYLREIGAPAFEKLNVTHPDMLLQFNTIVRDAALQELKAYAAWRMLLASFPLLPDAFVKENFEFFGKSLAGTKQPKPRERRCIEATDTALPDALGQLYVEKHFGKDAKARMQSMVKNVVGAFGSNLASVSWMTPQTKVVAKDKADTMGAKIGYPDRWRDTTKVTIHRDDPLGNLYRGRLYEHARNIAKIGQPVDKTEWFMSAPTVNAFYSGSRNDINFPAGILQSPFFDLKADEAINYGAIGSVIGHEITHGFDDRGRKFDKNGNLTEWWSMADAMAFEKQAECVVEQYSGYPAVDDLKLNGRLTLGENIADLGGVRVSLIAYLTTKPNAVKVNGFTPEQRFFLGYAQVWCSQMRPETARVRALTDSHSSPRWRVNGVVSNMPEFAKAFGCKKGDAMVREKACRVW